MSGREQAEARKVSGPARPEIVGGDAAHSAIKSGLVLNPTFIISRTRAA
jgi:hypothetical protein